MTGRPSLQLREVPDPQTMKQERLGHKKGFGDQETSQREIPAVEVLMVIESVDVLGQATAEKEIARRNGTVASQQGVANRREKLDIVLDAVDVVGL